MIHNNIIHHHQQHHPSIRYCVLRQLLYHPSPLPVSHPPYSHHYCIIIIRIFIHIKVERFFQQIPEAMWINKRHIRIEEYLNYHHHECPFQCPSYHHQRHHLLRLHHHPSQKIILIIISTTVHPTPYNIYHPLVPPLSYNNNNNKSNNSNNNNNNNKSDGTNYHHHHHHNPIQQHDHHDDVSAVPLLPTRIQLGL